MATPDTPRHEDSGATTGRRWPVLVAGLLIAGIVASGAWYAIGRDGSSEGDGRAVEESAPSDPSASVEAVETAEARDDGLMGAPVPPSVAQSAEFDADLLSQGGGRFDPLDDPLIVKADEASWMSDETLVLGAVQNGEARAYPIAMMRYHHVSNDVLGGEPYLVTF